MPTAPSTRWPCCVAATALLISLSRPPPARAAPPASSAAAAQRGVSLGLFSEDAGFSYRPLLAEIAALGADHVELVVAWYLDDVRATEVRDHPRYTAPLATIEAAVRDAHALGLRVFLFPILRLVRQDHPDEWRGTLRPRDRAALLASYRRRLIDLARLAEREQVALLSVGSELSTLDVDRGAWVPLVAAVRAAYHGRLTYSGNWDHYDRVAIYDLLDYAGLCGYFSLGDPLPPAAAQPSSLLLDLAPIEGHAAPAMEAAWRARRAELERFAARVGRPLLFTEIGYLSQRGAAAWPWNEGASEPIDLDEQRRAYAAFRAAWAGAPPSLLAGTYFWNWYGWGGPRSGGYTPRGKPAAREIEALFRAPPPR